MPDKQLIEQLNQPAEFDQYRDTYTDQISQSLAFSGQQHDFFTRVKANYLANILSDKNFFSNEIDALDIGCGHGLIHPYLLKQNNIKLKLSGVDVASSVIDVARVKNKDVSYQAYDGVTLPYADNKFDIVFAIGVMHHVPPQQWVAFLQEIKRVVKPKGHVLIFEHNPVNPLTLKVVKNCPIDKDAVLIRSKVMEKLMQQAGLKVIKRKFILFTPFDKPFFHRLDRRLGWLPLGAQYYVFSGKSI